MVEALCLILDASDAADTLATLLPPRARTRVLNFAPGGEIDPKVCAALEGAEFLDTRALYRAVLPAARTRFTQFVAEFPEKYKVAGKSFKQWLRRDGLSLWWLLELSQKNPESSPVFGTYCQAEILRSKLESGIFDQVIAIGGEDSALQALSSVCRRKGVSFRYYHANRRSGENIVRWVFRSSRGTLIGCLFRRIWFAFEACLRTSTARRLSSVQPSSAQPPAPGRFGFYSWFPAQWTNWKGKRRDRYFVDLPDVLQERGAEVLYICSFFGLGVAELRSVAESVKLIPDDSRQHMVWMDASTSVPEVARFYFDIRDWLRFEWLAWRNPQLKRSLADGLNVDLSVMLLRELRVSFALTLPYYLLLAEQIRRFVERYQPTHLLTILETYCIGRAITWGARRAKTGVRVVGMQHSPANANQLFYRYQPRELTGADPLPLPDDFLLHGKIAEGMLSDSGVQAERLHRVGAPRFEQLATWRQRRELDRNGLRRELDLPQEQEQKLILVAGVIWQRETLTILRWAFEAAAQMDDIVLVIKPHPLQRGITAALENLSKAFPHVKWTLVDHALNALQAAADVMVTGNSSSDTEALAIGCPVVKMATFDLSSSPTDDFPGSVAEANSIEELADAIRVIGNIKDRDRVVEWALGPVDEAITSRIIEVLIGA